MNYFLPRERLQILSLKMHKIPSLCSIILFGLCFFLQGCWSLDKTKDDKTIILEGLDELPQRQEQWQKLKPARYRIIQMELAQPGPLRESHLIVEGDKVVAILYKYHSKLNSTELQPASVQDVNFFYPATVEEVFESLHKLKKDPYLLRLTVTYDVQLGYPNFIDTIYEEESGYLKYTVEPL